MTFCSKSYRETDMVPRCYNQVSNNLKENSAYIHEIIQKLLITKCIFQWEMLNNIEPFCLKWLKYTNIMPAVLLSLVNICIYLQLIICNKIPSLSIRMNPVGMHLTMLDRQGAFSYSFHMGGRSENLLRILRCLVNSIGIKYLDMICDQINDVKHIRALLQRWVD